MGSQCFPCVQGFMISVEYPSSQKPLAGQRHMYVARDHEKLRHINVQNTVFHFLQGLT